MILICQREFRSNTTNLVKNKKQQINKIRVNIPISKTLSPYIEPYRPCLNNSNIEVKGFIKTIHWRTSGTCLTSYKTGVVNKNQLLNNDIKFLLSLPNASRTLVTSVREITKIITNTAANKR